MRSRSGPLEFVFSHPCAEKPAHGWGTGHLWRIEIEKTGCPTLAASLFLRLGQDCTANEGSASR
jgi:hypothetical protein